MCLLRSAAEIKHGRISMLAVVGFLLTQYVHLPGDQFQVGPLEAVTSLPLAVHVQIFSFIAVFEASSIFTTFSDKKDPWELLIQDPSGSKGFYKKDAAEQERLKQSEVKHSRLAMFAIIGEVVQMMLYHKVGTVGSIWLAPCQSKALKTRNSRRSEDLPSRRVCRGS
ncbi:unnamed protein product [Ascophyllum nodosum]